MDDMGGIKVDKILKDNNIKPSYQRARILQYLLEHKNHPTVDKIHKSLVNEIPTLSKTTVYNTLNLFLKNNVAQAVVIEENECRYDANISTHGHFKCKDCGEIYDFHIDVERDNLKELDGFKIEEKHIYFKGICKHCIK